MSTCFCIGPQNGEPLCPCRMRDVKVVDGRYVTITDHGPAPENPKKQTKPPVHKLWNGGSHY